MCWFCLTLLVALQEEEGQQTLECVQANQIFPKKSPVLEEENMQVSQNIWTTEVFAFKKT